MNKTKELNPTAGAERPGKREKLKRHARRLGALALSVAAAVGISGMRHISLRWIVGKCAKRQV